MKKIMILSGAGLSAESGIRTFRDHDGLCEFHDVREACSTQGWIKDRKTVTQFYNDRRHDLEFKEPNHAHKILSQLEHNYRGRVIHLTQNIDNRYRTCRHGNRLCYRVGFGNVLSVLLKIITQRGIYVHRDSRVRDS